MNVAAAWYPIALSKDIEPAKPAGARLLDRELCIWRDSVGEVHAWEDRCPHRGMRLSFGFVRGDHLACLYHGWRYDPQGHCRQIPAHPDLDVPTTIQVAKYSCIERLGMVWVYADLTAPMPAGPVIALRDLTPVRSLYIDRKLEIVAGALMARSNGANAGQDALLTLDVSERDVIVGLHPVSGEKTALHIVITNGSVERRGAARLAVAVWAEELRRSLEEDTIIVTDGQAERVTS